MKTKMFVSWSLNNFPLAVLSFMFISIALVSSAMAFMGFIESKFPAYVVPGVQVARAEKSEMPLRLWALNLAYSEGLDVNKFDCIINAESKWNPNAYNVNKNGSFDLGVAQWNSMHIKSGFIKLACVADPICSIKKMIEKVKKDKGFSAWVAAKNCR